MPEPFCTVSIVEGVSLGEVFWKTPFAETCNLITFEQTGTVAQWAPLDVMESYGNAISEKGGAFSGAGFEEAGGIGCDLLNGLQKVRSGIEGNGASEGLKGRAIRPSMRSPDFVQRGVSRRQAVEVTGRLSIRAFVDVPDEFNNISPAAMGEAAPEVFPKVYPESRWVVPSMKRTGAGKLVIFCLEMRIQSIGGKDLPDGNTGFEEVEAVGVQDFLLSRPSLIGTWLPGVKFQEEFFVQLSEFPLGGRLQEFCRHHIEYSQISKTVLDQGFLERFAHQMWRRGLLQDMVEIGQQMISGERFQDKPRTYAGSQRDQFLGAHSFREPRIPTQNGSQDTLGIKVGA